MINVKIDAKNLNKILNNTVSYTQGFVGGINSEKINFQKELASYTIKFLYKYIDSQARINPHELHHVYEWNEVGNPSARLFEINKRINGNNIEIYGNFLVSKKIPDGGTEPFKNKAEIMENNISVVISPNNSPVLAFEQNGEMVFTTSSIFIEHPGGDAVAGSFGKVVEEFFNSYFNFAILQPILNDLKTPNEFYSMFPQAVNGNASLIGTNAGKKYMHFNQLGDIQ